MMRHKSINWIFPFLIVVPSFIVAAPAGDVAPSSGTNSSGDATIDQIDRSWMSAIHGSDSRIKAGNAEENKSDSGSSTDSESKQSDPIRFPNPSESSQNGDVRAKEILAAANPSAEAEAPSLIGVIFRFVSLLTIMIGLFFLIVRYVKKKTGVVHTGSDLVQVIASIPLMPGKFLQIVDMAGKLLVLGVSEAGVHMITTIEDSVTADRIRIWHSSRPGEALPENLMGQLTSILRGMDLRFWSGEGNGAPIRKKRESFSGALDGALGLAGGGNGHNGHSEENELRDMLRHQKKRIARLKETELDEGGLGQE